MILRKPWIVAAVSFLAALCLLLNEAASRLPFGNWPSLPFDPGTMTMDQIILAFSVFPRAAVALLAGAALGLSGALFQRLLRNPIADPSTLGVSAGAQLAIVVATLFFPSVLDGQRSLVALGGASAATILVFMLGWRRDFEPVTMVVSGLLVGVTASALSAALTLSQGEYLMSLVTWNGGSLSQQDWSVSGTLAIELVIGMGLTLVLLRPLVLLGLADTTSGSLGVSLTAARVGIAAIAVGLAASVAANVGLVSFIGLAAPALVRAFGVRKPSHIVFASPLAGALLLWICDGLVQLLASTTAENFPTGAITALFGGPVLLWLLPRIRFQPARSQPGPSSIAAQSSHRLWLLVLSLPVVAFIALGLGKTISGWTVLSHADFLDLLPLRWPRLLAASAAGGLLALAGAILQRLTGNPMASPEVLGVSGGAGIGFAAAISIIPAAGLAELFIGAGTGALLVMIVLLAFASRRHLPPERLLLAGIAVSSLTSAVLSALLAIGDQRSWQILAWLGGTASTATPAMALLLSILAVIALSVSLLLVRWLTIFPLGDAVPQALGISLVPSRVAIILIAGLATAAAALLVGPLSFVGLMAPHLALRAGFIRARDQICASFLIGALIMIIADLGARTVTFPYELPLGLFAALAGASYLIWLIGKRK